MPYKRAKRAYSATVSKVPARRALIVRRKTLKQMRKMRPAILWYNRTMGKGLGFPQATTFPAVYYTTLHYNKVGSLVSTGSAANFVASYFFRLNNVYDPDQTGTGGQPYYYDTLFGGNGAAAPYREWRVIRTRVDVEFYNDNTSGAAATMCGMTCDTNVSSVAATVAGSQLLMQRPNTRIIPVAPLSSGTATSGFTTYVDHKKLLGVKDMKDADDQIGTYNTSPTGAVINAVLWQFPIDTASVTQIEVWYRIHITYTVECRGLNTVDES